MKCPSCKEPLVILELHGVEIDHCFNCGGVWLDAGELEEIVPREKLGFLKAVEDAKKLREPILRCPVCRKKMTKVYWSVCNNIILDRCAKPDGGLWFDKDELAELLAHCLDESGREVLALMQEIFQKTDLKNPAKPNQC